MVKVLLLRNSKQRNISCHNLEIHYEKFVLCNIRERESITEIFWNLCTFF